MGGTDSCCPSLDFRCSLQQSFKLSTEPVAYALISFVKHDSNSKTSLHINQPKSFVHCGLGIVVVAVDEGSGPSEFPTERARLIFGTPSLRQFAVPLWRHLFLY